MRIAIACLVFGALLSVALGVFVYTNPAARNTVLQAIDMVSC